jgi:isoamylase
LNFHHVFDLIGILKKLREDYKMSNILLQTKTNKTVAEGKFYPLGATLTPKGVNFTLYSKHAQEVFLLLFDHPQDQPTDIIKLENKTKFIWHTFVYGLKSGQLYGYKVRGNFNPRQGLRFNENKFLLDPYAKAFTGKVVNTDNLLLAYNPEDSFKDLSLDNRDNTGVMPKCIVIDDSFDWQDDADFDISLEKSIIYEVHLKGFTAHSSSGVKHPGSYLGFIEKIPYLKKLGITAVEFLPLQEFYVEDMLISKGLTNYWGYNTIGFFAPESSYAAGTAPGCQVQEFKTLVRELHKFGIEVILDVVYNHTGEGNELGPTISFKGIDNPTYYSLTGDSEGPARYYMNYTGCGNSLNAADPYIIRFMMDSLRYWVEVMHVDGFRFDLASVLGRENGAFTKTSAFFDALSQDPLLNKVKLIAEPWDIATYQVGNFPVDWSEWNGRFRDTLRKFGKGDGGQIKDLGWRLTGSADLYGDDGRSAYNSINFITCHDGFTLNDLVSYNYKHNEANLECNNDGTNDNNSWNCGIEGETDDLNIISLRKQLVKNYFCYLLFSYGTPMLLGGDEFLRTQKGNNNAYCQDNELNWFNWDFIKKYEDIFNFCRKTIALTKKFKALQRRKYSAEHDGLHIEWFGKNLDSPDWDNFDERTLSVKMSDKFSTGEGYSIFIIFNVDYKPQQVMLPLLSDGMVWRRIIDTSLTAGEDFLEPDNSVLITPSASYLANPRSTVVLFSK